MIRTFLLGLFLINLSLSCNPSVAAADDFDLRIVNGSYPLRLQQIDLGGETMSAHKNCKERITALVKEYYQNDCSADSLSTFSDAYIGTVQLQDNRYHLYLVLLRHLPTGLVNGWVLFYNRATKNFLPGVSDLNLHALYDYDNGKLVPSNLKQELHIESPEIDILDFNKDSILDYKLTRLYHNGTDNKLQTTIISIKEDKLDTLSFTETKLTGL